MVKNELLLDYVASGFCASFRLGTPHKDFGEGIVRNLIPASQYLRDKLGGHVKISGLFNAFTEDMFATRIKESGYNFKTLFPDAMYADSGGLQVLTQGKQIDEEMKKKIYDIQAEYADYAMSFDVMPFEMVNGGKKYLGDEVAAECGTQAGENLKEQIAHFNKIKAKTKIFPIVQGLGLTGMSAYTLNMLSVLNKTQLDKLECLAVGGITSEIELLERSVNIYKIAGIPDKIKTHFHVLGVTGFRKLMPILIGARNGLIPGIKKLSFDSTTFTKSYLLGNIQPSIIDLKANAPKRSLGKVRDAFVEDYYQQMWDFWKDIPDNVFENVEDMIEHSCFNSKGLSTAAQQYKELGLEHGVKTITQKYVYVYYNTFKFLEILEMYLDGVLELEDFMGKEYNTELLYKLEKITDYDSFKDWNKYATQNRKIDRISAGDGRETTRHLGIDDDEIKKIEKPKKQKKESLVVSDITDAIF
jgi:hypothetical protein